MATLKELAYKKATTPKGAIAVIDNAMAQTKDPAQIAALSQARQALTNPGQSPNETPSWFTKFIEPYVKSTQQQAQSQMGVSQAVGDNAAQAALAADAEYYGWSNNNPARQAGAVNPQIVIPNKPDPMSGDYWKVTTDANGVAKGEVDWVKYAAAFEAWQAAMNKAGYPTSQYVTAPAGTVGQVGSGTDAKGNIYSAMVGPDGNTQMLNAQQIQQSVRQDANPQTSRDRAAADSLVAIIKGWGLQDDVQVGEMGAITFPSPKALTAYTGIVSQRMLDVLRNGGTQVDALNAGGYQVVARESDAWKAYAAQQGRK